MGDAALEGLVRRALIAELLVEGGEGGVDFV